MASSVKYVRVGPNSASIEAARRRVFDFFKTACRSIPAIMEVYNRDDVVTLSQLRSNVTSKIRKNAHVNNPKGTGPTRLQSLIRRAVAQVGEHVKFEACMDVMDLLYENEETSVLYSSPEALAASVVVIAYIITVPAQRWEFPVLPWGLREEVLGFGEEVVQVLSLS